MRYSMMSFYLLLLYSQTVDFPLGVLPSDCAMLYYILDTQLFLHPQLLPHREKLKARTFTSFAV